MTNKPVKTAKSGAWEISAWENEVEPGKIRRSISIRRSYKKGDEWHDHKIYCNSNAELLKLVSVIFAFAADGVKITDNKSEYPVTSLPLPEAKVPVEPVGTQ